jgi:hypothetical protein
LRVPERNESGSAGGKVPDTERPVAGVIKVSGPVLGVNCALDSREGRCLFRGVCPNVVLPIYSGKNVLSLTLKT